MKNFFYTFLIFVFSLIGASFGFAAGDALEKKPSELHQLNGQYDYDLDISNEELDRLEKYLVILMDMYGNQKYSKVVIVDVDMETSVLVAKDLFQRINTGIYTVVGASADNLISQRLIIR